MAVQSLAARKAAAISPALRTYVEPQAIYTTELHGAQVRLVVLEGQVMACVPHVLQRICGYSRHVFGAAFLTRDFKARGFEFNDFARLVVGEFGMGWFMNDAGLRVVCSIKSDRSEKLAAWLDAGGLNLPAAAAKVGAITAPAGSADGEAAPASLKGYCARLAEVIGRYVTAEEMREFAAHLEGFARSITARRYCPGLNDAAYDLYAASQLRRA